jgi:DNA polymerase-1
MRDEGLYPKPLGLPLTGQFDVMIVGESPGKPEESTGLPMQDEAGNILIDMCRKAGFDFDRVYVTYIVKCNPPRAKATVKEIKGCRDCQLFPEIKAVDPQVIMLLGNNATRAFNLHNQGGMNNIHGKVFTLPLPGEDAPTYNVIPTFAPSMFVYHPNPRLQQRVIQDYQTASMVMSQTPMAQPEPVTWSLVKDLDTLQWMVNEIKEAGLVACDTESAGLPWRRHKMLCMSFCWGKGESAVVPFWQHDQDRVDARLFYPEEENIPENMLFDTWDPETKPKALQLLASVFEVPTVRKIFHNYKYDANVIWHWTGIRIAGFIRDTMVMHHVLHEDGSHKLEDLADEEFGYGDYSEAIRAIVGTGKKLLKLYDCIPDGTLWPYAATDTECTWRLNQVYEARLRAQPHLWNLYKTASEPLLHALVKAEWNGHKINVPLIDVLDKEYQAKQDKLLLDMQSVTSPDFKPLSNPQVVQALINLGYGERIRDKKAASGFKADKKILTELQDELPLAGQLLEYRSNRKIISTYLKNAKEDIDEDGRIRHSWYPLTMTGRLSCRFFHQIPNADPRRIAAGLPVLRDLFVVDDNCSMVYADYSQVELRILAILSQDQEMLRLMNDPNADLHAATTYEFLKTVWPDFTEAMASTKAQKFNRTQVGKRVNFGLAYGSEGFSLVKTGKWMDWDGRERPFTWDMLNMGMEHWKARFPGVIQYIEDVPLRAIANGGTIQNVFGRERRLGSRLNLADEFLRAAAEREAVNFTIQSAAAEITNRTISTMDQVLDSFIDTKELVEGHIRMINTVHDSVAYEVRKSLVPWFTEVLRSVGERPVPELNNEAFKLDIGTGPTWTLAE